jgi:glyoxylase-like metal-dependent hydrolase (beta-lactamase superfamily II)
MNDYQVIDLRFLGYTQTIAIYAFPHSKGVALIECGPGSTLVSLEKSLEKIGFTLDKITDVFLTHIHLDHAGAAGALARHGARIHVHVNGALHLIDPEKLLTSAKRIYLDDMDRLWGEFLAVPESHLNVLEDGSEIKIGNLTFLALDTPGHANHHFAYLVRNTCFTGDVGGIRMPGSKHIRLPMPPPELNLEMWRKSVQKLRGESFNQIAPTHFGIFDDPKWHLDMLDQLIDTIDEWISTIMPEDPDVNQINQQFLEWTTQRTKLEDVPLEISQKYEAANPSWMTATGIQRYWKKYRSSPG